MAASVCCLRAVLSQCHRHILKKAGNNAPSLTCTNRSWAFIRFYAAPATSKAKQKEKEKEIKSKNEKEIKEDIEQKRKDTSRAKPYGFTAWEPTDDVYIARYYPKPTLEVETATNLLKKYQTLDFTYSNQAVYAELKLDMKMEKKKKVDPFVGYLNYPYPFSTEDNKIVVFTEDAEAVEIAKCNGVAFVGGSELVEQVLNDEIQADFYVATPDIIPKLNPLKNKLRKKFPKSKRGSVGRDIPKMLQLFRTCHEYLVENECLIKTKIATLEMPCEHIAANLDALIKDACTHKPLSYGPFVERVIISSATSEALFIKFQKFLPQQPEKESDN
ncbi:large ribosomal subunit protein uL1m [Pelobates fuscus]|uniref:large ribosomal subunit protein uL1m n=1 Tax=Pelobates fuscus TaxID=191477 RepID=UPI002FE49A30